MTIKTLFFALFLYVCLVWVWALRTYSGEELKSFGYLWTAVGIAALLVMILAARLFA